eukprot:scaffold12160_cov23-Prasinocladus_malaysianus.AAC.1
MAAVFGAVCNVKLDSNHLLAPAVRIRSVTGTHAGGSPGCAQCHGPRHDDQQGAGNGFKGIIPIRNCGSVASDDGSLAVGG